MSPVILLIAAYLPILVVLFMVLRSGSFGKGSVGTLLKLFFLGAGAAVLAFLMEAGCLLVLNIILGLFSENSFGGSFPVVSAVLQSLIAVALIEEGWKFFILKKMTWEQMTMETTADGISAAAVVSAGFSMIFYGAWQAAYHLIPADMVSLRRGMPVFLRAGSVTAFIYALLFAFGHFGFSGLMGAFYGAAKTLQQKEHGKRAGFMLVFSFILPVLAHGACAALIVYGIEKEKVLWLVIGLLAQTALAVLMAMTLSNASDAGADDFNRNEDRKVDFGDSEEFAGFAEASGSGDSPDKPDFADTDEKPEDPQESDAAGPADDDGNTAGAESGKSSADDF